MSVASVLQHGTTAAQAATGTSAASSTAQSADQALTMFAQALGDAMSFESAGSLSSLTSVLNSAVKTQAAPVTTGPWMQPNQAPVNASPANATDNNSAQDATASAANSGPAPQASTASVNRNSTNGQNAQASESSSSNTDQQSNAASAGSDTQQAAVQAANDGSAQAAMAMAAQVAAQTAAPTASTPQAVQTQTIQTGPSTATVAGAGQNANPAAGQAGGAAGFAENLANNTANAGSGYTDTNAAIQAPVSGVAQQASHLAQSLFGTGANLSVQTTVVNTNAAIQSGTANSQTATQTDTSAQTAVATLTAQAVQAQTPSNQGGGQSGNGQDDSLQAGQQLTADVSSQGTGNQSTPVQAFSAVLAAQIQGGAATEADTQAPQAAQAITAVGAMTAPQGAQKTQAAQAPQAPQAPQQPQAPEPADQVAVEINKQAKDGVDTIKVQMKPKELGAIEVKLEVAQDGTVKATVTADNKDTLAMLQKDAPTLVKALSDAGLQADSNSLDFNLRGDPQNQQQQQQLAGDSNSGSGNGNGSGNGRNPWTPLIADPDDVPAGVLQSGLDPNANVDIRV